MRSYRCFFLDLRSGIRAVEIVEAESDSEAAQRAEAVFREKGTQFSDYELWDCGRRIPSGIAQSR